MGKISLSTRVYPATWLDYSRLDRIGDKAKYYVPCLYIGRVIPTSRKIRKLLLELLINSVRL